MKDVDIFVYILFCVFNSNIALICSKFFKNCSV